MAVPQTCEAVGAQDDFLMILPEIGRLLRWCFRHEGADRREELVQDALCQCWAMYFRAHERGKRLAAHGLAWYGWLATRSGRRFCWESKRSVSQWESLTGLDLDELLAADWKERWPVADQVAFRIDWSEFVSHQADEDANAMALLAVGNSRCEAAKALGRSSAWMTQHMGRVYEGWQEFIET